MELSRRPRVRLVLPARDEQRALPGSVERLLGFCAGRLGAYDWRLLVAQNGSRDATAALADRLAGADPRVDRLHLPRAGRGGALLAAAGLPGADYLVYTDVDLSADLAALPRLLRALDAGADLAVGNRLHPAARVQRRLHRELLSRGYNRLVRQALGARAFHDAQCGLKAWRQDRLAPILARVEDRAWFFDTELLVLAEAAGLTIVEVPLDWTEDPDSRVELPSAIYHKLRGLLRLARRRRRNGAWCD